MNKLLIGVTILISSCSLKQNRIYYSTNTKKCIHNLNEMQRWLQEDYVNGDIPKHVAENYMLVIINTKCGLYKKINKNHTDCTD